MSAYLPYTGRLRSFLVACDFFSITLAAWLAHVARFSGPSRASKIDELLTNPGLVVWAVVTGLLIATAGELYEPEVLLRRREILVRVAVTVAAWAAAMVLATYLWQDWAYGRGLLFLTSVYWAGFAITVRWFLTARLRRGPRFAALVVGESNTVQDFCQALSARPSAPWKPVDGSGFGIEEIGRSIRNSEASIVVLASGEEHATQIGPLLANLHFSGVPVVAASEIWAWLEERLPLEALSPAIFLHQPGFGSIHWTLFNRLTRLADIALAALMLILALPLLVITAILIRITNGSPVVYQQQRLGQFGRPFTMLKLRTMTVDAELSGPEFADARDPRATALGGFLRRFRIDELPQLINVLKGEMSLVGPRPERPEFVARLSREIPYYAFRMSVPPGITGWAQVNVPYAASQLEDHKRKLEFDLYFIRERSTRLYLLTLLRTVSAALVGVRNTELSIPDNSSSNV